MRPIKLGIRFVIAAGVVLTFASPAAASTPGPEDVYPNPARQAVFHRTQSSGVVLGTLRIPAIGIDETIRSGVAMSVIDQGVAHWSGTARPGEYGNVVLAGHRTTKTQSFLDLDKLVRGDLVFLTDGEGFEVIYRVSSTIIVDPSELWITYDSTSPTVTMFACHPKRSERYRIVVRADLVAGRLIA